MVETYRRRSKRQNEEEPEFAQFESYQVTEFQNIYPTCENGESLDAKKTNRTKHLTKIAKKFSCLPMKQVLAFVEGQID